MTSLASKAFKVIRSNERGYANHGWLKSRHTFSFASYYNPDRNSFGSLRVINEDHVDAQEGFPTHPHKDFEIFSIILDGALTHRDSMGNVETLKRGHVQFTTAGSGIAHSEINEHPSAPVHFLQIWVKPRAKGLTPGYQTRFFSEDDKKNTLKLIISPDGRDNTIKINQDTKVWTSLLSKGASLETKIADSHQGFIHVAESGGNLKVNDQIELQPGDALMVEAPAPLKLVGSSEKAAEFVLFELKHE